MIINTLALHNFMSYADINLELTSVDVACLSGRNGSGKSALLDAITWALWERARAGSDELIRIGEKEMWVDMVFSYEGRTYRVRRSRQKKLSKKGGKASSKGTLEFQVLMEVESDEAAEPVGAYSLGSGAINQVVASKPALKTKEGRWKSLTGGSMRATQQVITDLLRMEFDTFINSAYLRQGRADEFTTRSPGERKQVLSEILGLSYFERLKESCRFKMRESKGKIELLAELVKDLPQMESTASELEEQLKVSSGALGELDIKFEELEKDYKAKQSAFQKLLLASQKKEANLANIKELRSDLEEHRRRSTVLGGKLKAIEDLIGDSGHIEEQSKKFTEIRKKTEELDRKSLDLQGLNEEKHELKSKLASIRSRLEVEADHAKSQLKELEDRLLRLETDTADKDKVDSLYKEYRELIQSEAESSGKQEAFARLNARSNELQSLITETRIKLEAEAAQRRNALEELGKIVESDKSLSEKKASLEESAGLMDQYETELEHVEGKGLEAKSQIEHLEQKIADLKRRKLENLERIRELEDHDHSSICPLCSAPIVDRSKVIGRYRTQIEGFEQETLETAEEIKSVEENRAELRNEYKRLRKLLEGRKELDKQIGQFNERSSSVERARSNFANLEKELAELNRRLEAGDYAQVDRESLVNLKAEVHKLDFDPVIHANLQSQIRMKRHVESRKQSLDKDLAELEKVKERLPQFKEKVSQLMDQLDTESYGAAERQALKELGKKLEGLNYDRESHMQLKKELAELLPFAEQLNELARAKEEKPELVKGIEEVNAKIERAEKRIADLEAESRGFDEEAKKVPELETELKELEGEIKQLSSAREESSRTVAVLESQREEALKSISGLKEKAEELGHLRQEKEDYALLSEAFGKKGIQAIIIENAIPEIESEANRILSRLTDNKMHIALVTQHKTKSGSITETLDILIGDEVGTRSYELYSGGEAFKVNFSIRIALSRLLARRAGARLETLIIDEGFGSQDDRSRERLVRAIRAIQSDFSRILVITHFSDVQEMFPTQIQVTKEEGVSRLQIVS